MPSVAAPKEFFVHERRIYSNWQFAFWREDTQNSVDAGCRNIWIRLTEKAPRHLGIDFEDDGKGMSREILENVFFRLGASTKNDGSTVGGFGRARILTCFSMENYTIHTQDNLVQGDGGSYEIATVDHRKGCLLQVEVKGESLSTMQDALHEYLSMCQLPCEVYINGERWTTWCYRRQLTRTLNLGDAPFANVYVNKSGSPRLIVRVNGTVMYWQSIRAKAQVIVEIHPDMSREVLTANRDGMQSKYQYVLNNFVEELAVETVTALQPKRKNKGGTFKGRGLICSRSPNPKKAERLALAESRESVVNAIASQASSGLYSSAVKGPSPEQPVGLAGGVYGAGGKTSSLPPVHVAEFTGDVAKISGTIGVTVEQPPAPLKPKLGEKYLRNLPDVFIHDETENPLVRKIIEQYNPENWIVCETAGKPYNKGNHLYKLLMLWKVACQGAVEALMDAFPKVDQVLWGLGWCFDDNADARCSSVTGGQALLLNPVDKEGKMRYGLRSKEDQKKLMALAKHEVAHMLVSYHNEEYASVLTEIDAHFSEKENYRKMQEALAMAA
jgi:hypothetical protein